MVSALVGQAWIRIALHMAGAQILSEATLLRDVRFLNEQAGLAVGMPVVTNTAAILRTLALAVATCPEVPLATPMASTFGGS